MSEQMPNTNEGGNSEAANQAAETIKQLDEQQLTQLGKIAEMLQARDISTGAVNEINKVGMSEWQVVTKGVDGEEPTVHDLKSTRVEFKPTKASAGNKPIEELIINRAAPTTVRPAKRLPKRFNDESAIVGSDNQISYRLVNGIWQPTHDEKAMEVFQQIVRDTQPNKVIFLGDNVDLPNMSRFESDPNFLQSTQKSLDRWHLELARTRANAPDAEIIVIEGNHDERWVKNIRKNAAEVLGIRRANVAHELSVLSLAYLLRVDELEVKYLPGYPANRYWLNNNLKAIHGSIVRSGGSTAAAVANSETTSTLFGHIHRIESHHRTINEAGGGRIISAHSFGTLSRIDGAVPSFGYGRGEQGEPLEHYENWQQGMGFVLYKRGDGPHDVQTINIKTFDEYRTNFNGKVYQPVPPLRAVPEAA